MNFNRDRQIDASIRFREFQETDSSNPPIEIESFRYRNRHYGIRSIRESVREKVGEYEFIHFVVETNQDAVFNVVFDTETLAWFMIDEMDPFLNQPSLGKTTSIPPSSSCRSVPYAEAISLYL